MSNRLMWQTASLVVELHPSQSQSVSQSVSQKFPFLRWIWLRFWSRVWRLVVFLGIMRGSPSNVSMSSNKIVKSVVSEYVLCLNESGWLDLVGRCSFALVGEWSLSVILMASISFRHKQGSWASLYHLSRGMFWYWPDMTFGDRGPRRTWPELT